MKFNKKALFILILSVSALIGINVNAMTEQEADQYNNLYYPQSVYNGGINSMSQSDTQEAYVDPATGSTHIKATDVTLPGRNGFDLNITRIYNSQNSALFEAYLKETDVPYQQAYYMIRGYKKTYKYYIDNTDTTEYESDICLTPKFITYNKSKTAVWMVQNSNSYEYDYTEDPAISKLFTTHEEAMETIEYLETNDWDIDASFPYSNTPYYKVDYYDFEVETVWKTLTYTDYTDSLSDDTATERYSRLGSGWEFDFPYVETRYGYEETFEYLHFGNKGTYVSLGVDYTEKYYDEFGNPATEVIYAEEEDEDGYQIPYSVTQYAYDTSQRPVSKEVYDKNNTLIYKETYSYEITSNYQKKTTTIVGDENTPSVVTSEYFDSFGSKIKTETGSDYETYVNDYQGNVLSVKSARANNEGWSESKSFEYNYMNKPTKETDELGNFVRAEYDALGRKVKEYDQNGYATEYKYDNLGRVIEQKSPIEEISGTVYYAVKKMWYDGNGNLIKERVNTNASGEAETYNEVEYTYDNRNKLIMTKAYDGEKYSYVQNCYDAKGNLLRVYTGLSSPLTINGLDDVTVSADNEYAVTKYSYDALGRLLETTDALGKAESNTYDKATGLMLSSTDRNGQSFSYGYDGLGNLTSKSLADGTNAETTVYGATGQPVSKQNAVTTINYTYNDKGLLVSENDTAAGTVKSYTYDLNGNRLTFTLTRNGQVEINQSYSYDKLNRLVSVSENGAVIAQYSYDMITI